VRVAGLLAFTLLLSASVVRGEPGADGLHGGEALTARAAMLDSAGRNVGDAVLTQTPHGVLLKVDLRGVKPGIHGFHIHQTGRCDPPTFESANGHFAPNGHQHGFLDDTGPHAGDLPNVHVLASGDLSVEYLVGNVTLQAGDAGALLDGDGSALVMHAGADDYHTNPAGAAGARIVCGVVMR
jgi:Cu-Zn family superoxide dismutase